METVSFTRQLSVAENVDVLVVGAGPAGIGAAVCAARNGARTLVFDQNGCVGGQATTGLVGPFMTCKTKKWSSGVSLRRLWPV